MKGVETKFGYVRLYGIPIIKKHKRSRIILEKGTTLVSKSKYNVAGINHPVILATVAEKAVITINGCGISGSAIVCVKSVCIGKNSGLGANSCVYDTDFHLLDPDARLKQKSIIEASSAPVIIGDNVWVGANVTILKGVSIGNNTIIGIGSIVTKSIVENEIFAGNPAKSIKK